MRIAILQHDMAEPALAQQLVRQMGHFGVTFNQLDECVRAQHYDAYDAIVVDSQLTATSAEHVIRELRAAIGPTVPLFLVAQDTSEDAIAKIFASGVDGYTARPLRPAEFVARLAALLRRMPSGWQVCSLLCLSNYTVDFSLCRITLKGRQLSLRHEEFEVAALLFRNIEQMVLNEQIANVAWRLGSFPLTEAIHQYMRGIRRRLKFGTATGLNLQAIDDVGYRLELTGVDRHIV